MKLRSKDNNLLNRRELSIKRALLGISILQKRPLLQHHRINKNIAYHEIQGLVSEKANLYSKERTNRIFALQRKNDVIGMVLSGVPSKEIREYLVSKYGITPGSAHIFLNKARGEIKKRKELEIQPLISLHIHRCEEIYGKLKELGAVAYCMDVLKHKERLLQFHREGFHLKVNKGEIQTVSLSVIDNEYDLNKLNVKEQEEISRLLHKAKKDGNEAEGADR